jgi:hypothetical protein
MCIENDIYKVKAATNAISKALVAEAAMVPEPPVCSEAAAPEVLDELSLLVELDPEEGVPGVTGLISYRSSALMTERAFVTSPRFPFQAALHVLHVVLVGSLAVSRSTLGGSLNQGLDGVRNERGHESGASVRSDCAALERAGLDSAHALGLADLKENIVLRKYRRSVHEIAGLFGPSLGAVGLFCVSVCHG